MKNPRVLIVDDYEVDRILLREFLDRRGITVLVAESGEEAVEKVTGFKPDLVLLDIKMADIDGFETCQRIKENNPGTIIVFVTSDESLETRRKAYSMGAQDIIYKPYDGPVLLDIIKNNISIRNDLAKKSQTIFQLEEKENLYQEELEKSSHLKEVGLLTTVVAHDINNYLGGILGNLEIIEMYSRDNQEVIEACGEITKSIEDTSNLASMLTSFSRENSSLERKKVNLVEIIESSAKLLSKDKRFKAAIQVDIKNRVPLNISAVRGHISTVVINFLKNALEAVNDSGSVSVSVTKKFIRDAKLIEGIIETGEYAIISVVDNGPGISADKIKEINKPFQSSKSFGSGVGMMSALKHIKQYNGALNIESKPGKGTEVTVYFPLMTKLNLASHTQVLHKNLPSLSGLKALVIDDQKVMCKSLTRFLEKYGASVRSFDSEIDLDKIKEVTQDLDLLIIDFNIPSINTEKLIEYSTSINKSLQVVIISGGAIGEYFRQQYKCLEKPFSFNQLIEIIDWDKS